jgi:hypothetical protein
MPERCPFLTLKFPVVSIIRPNGTKALAANGLFIGQSAQFFEAVLDLAADAAAAS